MTYNCDKFEDVWNIVDRAEQIARWAHNNQRRNDGQPYITHPEAVAKAVKEKYEKLMGPHELALMVACAWLHDVFEDCKHIVGELTIDNLAHLFFGKLSSSTVISMYCTLSCLTKQENEAYVDFIYRNLIDVYAPLIKVEDINHNLSDHKPGARKDKYELAKAILTRKPINR